MLFTSTVHRNRVLLTLCIHDIAYISLELDPYRALVNPEIPHAFHSMVP